MPSPQPLSYSVNSSGDSTSYDSQPWSASRICVVAALFILSGLLEIGGGWFVWVFMRGRDGWPKDGHAWWVGLIGCVLLVGYGFIPTLQPIDDFGRIYAVYGGVFIAMSFIWAYALDGFVPDLGDIIGSIVALSGVSIILFWPR